LAAASSRQFSIFFRQPEQYFNEGEVSVSNHANDNDSLRLSHTDAQLDGTPADLPNLAVEIVTALCSIGAIVPVFMTGSFDTGSTIGTFTLAWSLISVARALLSHQTDAHAPSGRSALHSQAESFSRFVQ
jgi:hypothetical protein